MNVERAYREFRNEPPDAPWDTAATFDAIYEVAKAKGIEVEYLIQSKYSQGELAMKLIRFTTADSPNPCFGVVVRDQAVPFAVLQSKAGKSSPYLTDSRSYLANLPDSERAAKELLAWGEQHLGELG